MPIVVSRAAAIGYGPAASVTPAACAVAAACAAVTFELSNWTARCAPFRAAEGVVERGLHDGQQAEGED